MLALLLVLSPQVCRANIGETEAQCVARYGEESDVRDPLAFDVVGDKSATFTLKALGDSFTIDVIFLNGRDAHETIRKTDASRAMTEQQKDAVLDLERAGLQWKKQNIMYRTDSSNVTYGIEKWSRSDGAVATCWLSRKVKAQNQWNQIDLSTREYASAQRGLDRQDGAN